MHNRFFTPPRRRKPTASFALRDLLVWVTIICIFVAVRGYQLAVFVFVTGVLTFATDWAANVLSGKRQRADMRRKTAGKRRLRFALRGNQVLLSEPVAIAAIYLTLFRLTDFFLVMHYIPSAWLVIIYEPNGIGISLHTMVRCVNGLVAAYLLAHLFGTLLPYSDARRIDRIPMIAALSLVLALQLAIS